MEIYVLFLMIECNMLHSNGRKFLSVFIVTESHRTVCGCHIEGTVPSLFRVISVIARSDCKVSRPSRSLHLLDVTIAKRIHRFATCTKINTVSIRTNSNRCCLFVYLSRDRTINNIKLWCKSHHIVLKYCSLFSSIINLFILNLFIISLSVKKIM